MHTLHRFPWDPGRQPFQNTVLYTVQTESGRLQSQKKKKKHWIKVEVTCILYSEDQRSESWALMGKLKNLHLGLDHRGRCCCAPGLMCVCTAAASLQGCICGRDMSGGRPDSQWRCSCWSALLQLHPQLSAALKGGREWWFQCEDGIYINRKKKHRAQWATICLHPTIRLQVSRSFSRSTFGSWENATNNPFISITKHQNYNFMI